MFSPLEIAKSSMIDFEYWLCENIVPDFKFEKYSIIDLLFKVCGQQGNSDGVFQFFCKAFTDKEVVNSEISTTSYLGLNSHSLWLKLYQFSFLPNYSNVPKIFLLPPV